MTIEKFINLYKKRFIDVYAYDYQKGSSVEQLYILSDIVKSLINEKWVRTNQRYEQNKEKQVYYFSMEFLPGRMLKNNLLNLGMLNTVEKGLKQLNLDLDTLAKAEVDPALGNGGLGRLASCFMDSIASTGIPGHGCGIRYRYGLFKQKFVDGYQVELPENWLRNGNLWEVRKENKSVIVRFGGSVSLVPNQTGQLEAHYHDTLNILAVPYDVAQVGYQNGVVNNLRLWSAEIPYGEEEHFNLEKEREEIKKITEVLYPDDSNYDGQLLRLKQEYFFSSAGVQSIVRYFKRLNLPWLAFSDKIAIHINDTHPTLCIPELMRILLDEEHLSWEQAWEITKNTVSYTNHTILQEAMERWSCEMVETLLPRIYQIIVEINRRHIEKKELIYGTHLTYQTAIISDGQIKMANLAIIGSHSINGVAKLHTDILKNSTLRDFYDMYPWKFNNKTNGITQRRWLQLANPALTELLDKTIGTQWHFNHTELKLFKAYEQNADVLNQLAEVKKANKERFARYVLAEKGIELSTEAIFDVQIKRLHAYKRQLLNALHILLRYLDIKQGTNAEYYPRVFIFGAKAAPSYTYAKSIIKFINALADLINHDPDVNHLLKIVFVENYGVSLAELIIPAADISEQISLAGKEASGTSNMKLMLNGAITVGTLDGANVEIRDYVGEDNFFTFGMSNHDVEQFYRSGSYNARHIYETNPKVHRVLNALLDNTIPNIMHEGQEIFDSLVTYNDEYFVLQDFESYVMTQLEVDRLYQQKELWNRMSLHNIAQAGPFSSDYTILRYADEIWNLSPYKK
ncbi:MULTISPECIES: glycogen/starch/alpha-glucan phosphorylase [unclassified Granulicatella]|uniref:glycogen/starch/alpha-glucan phosphorylase n=1 Tax=unclassified Granulicatella TaxID=2630493 RepID=UPI0010733762|nr:MULTISPECIES: glycogen/starch/alpha-glucan phosphorylase [unclassified Granulicatella]MBF0780628.1 glycogen/starch/alpha-glucan phosphorylase [Granulicatella sp. 19428wC4_WM01]TFU94586.1 glycogen/starch/alpha-glucan phosphorylase [Granulicatella sp. WM01]